MGQNRAPNAIARALLIALVVSYGAAHADTADEPSVLIETRAAERRALTETITAYGVLEPDPDQIIAVSIPRAGLISRVWVELGQRVQAGERLLEIATAPDAVMQFQQARTALELAQRELERSQRLLEEQLATRAEVDAARRTVADAESTLTALRHKGMGRDAEIVAAPLDGVVARIDVQQGQRVQADTTTLLLASERTLIARLGVEPEDLARLQPHTPVEVSDVFDGGLTFTSVTGDIHASIDAVTRLVDVLVPVPAEHTGALVLGSALRARMRLAEVYGTVVPRSAVLHDDHGAHVFVVKQGRAQRVTVETGIAEGDWIAVTGAIKPGIPVIVRGNYGLTDGMPVRSTGR